MLCENYYVYEMHVKTMLEHYQETSRRITSLVDYCFNDKLLSYRISQSYMIFSDGVVRDLIDSAFKLYRDVLYVQDAFSVKTILRQKGVHSKYITSEQMNRIFKYMQIRIGGNEDTYMYLYSLFSFIREAIGIEITDEKIEESKNIFILMGILIHGIPTKDDMLSSYTGFIIKYLDKIMDDTVSVDDNIEYAIEKVSFNFWDYDIIPEECISDSLLDETISGKMFKVIEC
jgi:hypothetical protein